MNDMAPADVRADARAFAADVQWGVIFAGAISAAALAFVLHSFAAALGLSMGSTAPTWRDASFALVALSGLYLVLVAVLSYGFGGYIAGAMRARNAVGAAEGTEFRDGMHGLCVWALATLLTGLLAIASAQALTRLAAPSAGSAGPATSVAGENIIAYDLDRLFRGDRRPEANIEQARAEAARILLTASSHRGLQSEDRTHLTNLVAARTGIAPPEAERRVDQVVARAKENIQRARRAAVILAFMAGAAALLGAAVAWFAATVGGQHRDGSATRHPVWTWVTVRRV
jgi:hypothetical protein